MPKRGGLWSVKCPVQAHPFLLCPPLTHPHQGVQTTERTEPFREHPPSQTHRLRHTLLSFNQEIKITTDQRQMRVSLYHSATQDHTPEETISIGLLLGSRVFGNRRYSDCYQTLRSSVLLLSKDKETRSQPVDTAVTMALL